MLSNKSIDLLFILNKRECSTLEYLASRLNISKNTIFNLLDELEKYLESIQNSQIRIIRKSGKGVQLIDNFHEMNSILLELSKQYNLNDIDVFDGRCIQEILVLINEAKYLSLQELADAVYVSKGTIINDLNLVDKVLEIYNIQLVRIRNRGIKIEGNETDVRRLFSDIINGKLNKVPFQLLAYSNLNSLYDLFNKEFVDRVHHLIVKIISEDLELSNIQISAVLVHVMIAIQRVRSGESLKMPKENLAKIRPTKYFEISKKFSSEIEKLIGLTFDEDETGYIAIHLMCSKQVSQTYNLSKDEYDVIDEHLKEVVYEIIELISHETGNQSIEDHELIDGLIMHLKPAINRIKNNLSMKNPYLEEIKKSYLPSFDVAIKINKILDKEYGIGYNEHEIAYIALHVQAHIERYSDVIRICKKVAVVCSTGIGSSQLLMARLRKYFGRKIKFEAVSLLEIQKPHIQKLYDTILTTIPLDLVQKVVYIDPFFSESQLKKISELLNSTPKTISSDIHGNSVFKLSHIYIEREERTKESVLEYISDQLIKFENVQTDFINSVIDRESIASTAYGNFAIPHGDVALVKKSCIYIYVSKKGIKWGTKKVNVVFLIALNKDKYKEFKDIFDNLYEIISDDTKWNKLVGAENIKEIYKVMLGEI